MNHGGKRKGAGRKREADPRVPLSFRIKASLAGKAKRVGRDKVEAAIKRLRE
jgi:hypothetical protein